jgi:K+-sensing histidine kinase KdpD
MHLGQYTPPLDGTLSFSRRRTIYSVKENKMSKMRVLVVEDEVLTAKTLCAGLQRLGYEIADNVASGEEAVQVASETCPDIVLMDIRLAGEMDGIEAAAQIRAQRDVPIVYLTAYEDEPLLKQARLTAPYGHILKPFQERELQRTIELEVRMAERTAELAQANNALRQSADELSALNAIGYHVGSTLSLDQVIETSLEEIMGCVSADLVMLFLRQGDELYLRGTRTIHPQAERIEMKVHRVGECLCGLAASEGQAHYSSDIHADPLCTWHECKEASIRSFAALPLLSAEETLGVLGIASATVRHFGDQATFLQALSDQIALGLRNALLYQQTQQRATDLEEEIAERMRVEDALRRRNRELELIDRSSRAFSATLDLGQVLASILEEVRHLFGVATCSIWLLDPKSGELVARLASGVGGEVVQGWRLAPGQGIVGWSVQTEESVIVPDTSLDDRYYPEVDHETGTRMRSILCVPLRVQQGVIGAIEAADEKPGQFSSSDEAWLELLAISAASAIENAQLYEDLSLARREWEEIFQAIGHPTLILDPEHNIMAANRATVEAAGKPENALLGKKCYEVFHGSSCPAVGCPTEELFVTAEMETVEMEMEALGGVFLVSCTPVYDKNGHLRQVIHVATEITQRVRAEEALRRRNQELSILNTIAATIGQALDRDQLLDATLSKVLEITRLDIGWIQLVGEDAQGPLRIAAARGISEENVSELTACTDQMLIKTVIQSREPIVITSASCDSSISIEGEPTCALNAAPIQARDTVLGVLSVLSLEPGGMNSWQLQLLAAIGHQIGMAVENMRLLGYASEIDILREVDHMRSALIANVSHELRTPLGLIRVLSGALSMKGIDFDSETQRKFLRGIEEETHSLEIIVDNLLDLGHMESGRLQLDREPTDLVQLIKKVATSMAPQMERHRFAYDLSVGPVIATVDAERVEQMLRNLVSNAIKYSPEGETITICTYQDGSEALVSVSDEGIGVPVEEQDRIFERFYRVDNEVTRTTRGVGLGLAICRWIVQAHGGRIWVQSAPGTGSVFSAVFPIEIPETSQLARQIRSGDS